MSREGAGRACMAVSARPAGVPVRLTGHGRVGHGDDVRMCLVQAQKRVAMFATGGTFLAVDGGCVPVFLAVYLFSSSQEPIE